MTGKVQQINVLIRIHNGQKVINKILSIIIFSMRSHDLNVTTKESKVFLWKSRDLGIILKGETV